MTGLIVILCIILVAIVIVQIGRVTELANRIRGEEKSQVASNKANGKLMVLFGIVFLVGTAYSAGYGTTKAAVLGLTRALAAELGRNHIQVNAILPGFIETEMTASLDEKQVEGWRNSIPLKRGGTAEDVANACLFLASDLSAYVTGQVINVCGGMLT